MTDDVDLTKCISLKFGLNNCPLNRYEIVADVLPYNLVIINHLIVPTQLIFYNLYIICIRVKCLKY